MVYESLSSIVVLVIAVILVLGWLPFRTVKGMKRASEHRQDRLSTSLHMVGREDGMRFCDRQSRTVKGLVMQQGQQDGNRRSQAQRIKQIRQLRRAAIRRRRILVLVLLAVTLLVAGLSFSLGYSPWFTLIPLALVIVVLAAGAHASAQARAWERNLAQRRARQRRQQVASLTKSKTASKPVQTKNEGRTETATDVLDQDEIRRTLTQAKADQQAALKARRHNAAKPVKPAADSSKAKGSAGSLTSTEKAAAKTGHTSNRPSVAEKASERTPAKQAASGPTASKPATTKSSKAQKTASKPAIHSASPQSTPAQSAIAHTDKSGSASASAGKKRPSSSSLAKAQDDATNELERISPSPALDAFGTAAGQDLISFSLGSARDEGSGKDGKNSEDEAPHSLEIKSTRQVSVARPPEKKQPGQKKAHKKADGRPDDFHKREMQAQVEAPDRSEDSLSIGVEAILARRRPTAKS
ncbi:hypothetical protein J3T91_06160 [Bifidobacterium sp. B4001]|uniref:hypothetical protein n=1 Tax=unclassified Bifidobacterium TaxID=2608897 RepID=UPI00226BBC43|nr:MULTISPECIES: hypothetical protein [unclassified Bifidobacterium]MCX8673095.1 hypothetical protein [Bifidobacterium sp. B4079]MCX8681528.1 hypothetical protein [Bifidobacterium sp. B4001]